MGKLKYKDLDGNWKDLAPSQKEFDDFKDDTVSSLAEKVPMSDLLTPTVTTRMLAHGGFSSGAPMHTLPAYQLASQFGFWGVETDTHRTLDGEWVMSHDSTVDWMTTGTGEIKDLTLAQIKSYTVDNGNNVAIYPNLVLSTFQELLLFCRKHNIIPVIEYKADATAENFDSFVNVIKQYGFESRIVVINRDIANLQEIRNRSSKIALCWLDGISQYKINQVISLGNAFIGSDKQYVTKELVDLAHSHNLLVNVFTINDYDEAYTFAQMGVDFITSDRVMLGGVK